jgi:PAS domain S-box-containing protein
MTWHFQLYQLILLIAVGVALVVALVSWRRRETPGAAPLALIMLAVAVWAGLNLLEHAVVGFQNKLFFGKLQYLGIASVPALWLIFALSYCGWQRFLTRRNLILLWIIPVITIVIALTNDLHFWMWQVRENAQNPGGTLDYTLRGGWWYVAFVYNYAMIISGTVILLWTAASYRRNMRRQMWILLLAVLIPWIANILNFLRPYLFPDLTVDLTPFAFAVTGFILAFGLFRFRLFDLAPVARDLLIENMDDGVIVLDRENRIVDMNPAARSFLGVPQTPIGLGGQQVFAHWPELVERYRDTEQAQSEIRLESSTASSSAEYVELRISPLRDRRGQLIGRLITLHDITLRKQTETQLRQLSATVEQSPASVVITDLTGQIVYVNPKFTRLTGYTFEEASGQNPRILKSGETSAAEYERLWRTILAGQEWRGEFHNRKKSGELYWESAVISPVTDSSGHLTSFLAVKEDITARKQAEAIEQQRRQRQQLVSEISLAINLSEDVQSVMQAAVDGLTRVLSVDEVGLALFDESRQQLIVRADHPASGNQSAVGVELPLVGNLSTQRVVETRQPLMILDAQHDPLMSNVHEVMMRQQVQSILLVPLIVREEVIGTIGFDVLQAPRAFTPDEIDLARTVANLVAIRLEQARLFEAEREARLLAQRHAADLSGLYAVTRATSRSLVVDDVLAQALSAALTSLQFEAGLIALPGSNGASRDLQIAAERGLPAQLHTVLLSGADQPSILAHAYGQREVALVDLTQPAVDQRFQQAADDFSAQGWRMIVGIPLLHRDQPLGVMCLLTHQPRVASPIDMALFASMGHQVAAAISNAQLFQTTLDERSRLKALIESSRDGIILNSVNGTILVMNLPALAMLRLPGSPSDWVNRPIRDAIQEMRHTAPAAARATIKELRRLTTAAEPTATGDYDIAARPIHWQSLPVRVGSRPMGRLVVLRDMTEEHALERLREDMTHTMVHDLRNPLTGIVAALHMVLEGFVGDLRPEQRQVLSIAQSSSDRMMQLVNAILDVSRLESGRMPVNLTTVTVSDLLRGILAAQTTIAQEKHLQLDCTLPPDLPAVQADVALMQRVLQNLIGNAVKFTPESGCVRVVASMPAEFVKPPTVLISIRDNGPGIPLEIQSQLFQKFVTGGQQEHGSGLGLAFCKLALEAHGQRIWVESTAGEGTTFTFTLAVAA